MRCVNILSRLWHAPDAAEATGCSTTGSSEAAMLGGLALKRRWQKRNPGRRQAQPRDGDQRPGLLGEVRQLLGRRDAPRADGGRPVPPRRRGGREALRREHDRRGRDPGLDVRRLLRAGEGDLRGARRPPGEDRARHPGPRRRRVGRLRRPVVDPDLVWDFALPRVASINASGHKYGLVYPGVGWIVWRDSDALPADLIFWVNYLGDNMPTFALNFSRPGAQVVAQYYNFLRLGFDGYRKVHGYSREVATRLSAQIAELGPFELITRGDELPVFAFKLKDGIENFTVFDVSNAMRERGWQLPAYTFPKNREDLAALRVVVRLGFGHDLADLLIAGPEPAAAAAAGPGRAGARRDDRECLPPLSSRGTSRRRSTASRSISAGRASTSAAAPRSPRACCSSTGCSSSTWPFRPAATSRAASSARSTTGTTRRSSSGPTSRGTRTRRSTRRSSTTSWLAALPRRAVPGAARASLRRVGADAHRLRRRPGRDHGRRITPRSWCRSSETSWRGSVGLLGGFFAGTHFSNFSVDEVDPGPAVLCRPLRARRAGGDRRVGRLRPGPRRRARPSTSQAGAGRGSRRSRPGSPTSRG